MNLRRAGALLLATFAGLASAQPPCDGVAPPDPAALAADADTLRRNQPPVALARACARHRAAASTATGVELAQALAANERYDDAAALLGALAASAAPGSLAATEVALAQGTLESDQGAYARAAPHFERALAQLRALDQRGRLPALAAVGLSQALRTLREAPDALDRAAALLDEAERELKDAGLARSRDMGDLLNQRTMHAYARQDLAAAIGHARAEVALIRELDGADAPDAFDALASLGAMLSQLNRGDEAEAALNEGRRLMALHPAVSPAAQLGVLNNLSALQQDRGRYADALAVAEEAVAFAQQRFPKHPAMHLVAMNNRATCLMHLSRLAEAELRFEEARALLRANPGLPALRRLRLLDNLAELYTRLNDADAAQGVIDEGLGVAGRDASFGYWHGRLLRLQATLASARGRWDEVDALHARSAPLIAAVVGEQHAFVEVSTVHRCIAQVRGRLAGEACEALRRRASTLDTAVPLHRFRVHHALGLQADAAGRAGEAREHHLRALAAAQSAGTAHPLWIAYDALAEHLRRSGARALAIHFGKTAVEQIEAMRRDFSRTARDSERQFVADKHAVYRRLADWLAEDGRIDEALDVLRLLKAEEFLDFVRGAGDAPAPGGPALTPREAGWRAASPAAAGDSAAAEAERVQSWQALLGSEPADGRAPRAATAPAAARAPAGTLVAWLFAGDTHLNLVLDGPRGRTLQRRPQDPAALARDVGRLLAQIGRREDVLPLAQSLHARVAAPIAQAADAARVQRLVLHLDGALRYLPFAALHDGRRYLGERYAIEQRIAATDRSAGDAPANGGADAPLAEPPPREAYVRAFGVSRALAGLPALMAVPRELCSIVDGEVIGLDAADGPCERGLLPGAGWLNEAFTTERLRAVADGGTAVRELAPARRELLHLGTHFVLRPGHIGRSWLLTGDAQKLSLERFAAFDWRGQALITLSACETGLGGAQGADGREVDGLAALLARRGAGAVIASLWRVEDESTGALMTALYRALRSDADPARALQQAQDQVRRRADRAWRHPFFWAAFMVSRPERLQP